MDLRCLTLTMLALATTGCGKRYSDQARVVMGSRHTCALSSDGQAWCWGANAVGQLGDGSTVEHATPAPVQSEARFVQLTSGEYHTCAITETGEGYCWGWNNKGQLGDGSDAEFRTLPTPIAGNRAFKDIAAGGKHTCALTNSGLGFCWGENESGQVGTGRRPGADSTWPDVRAPVPISGAGAFVRITAGGNHSCAVSVTTRLFCWGSNEHGKLGIGRSGGRLNEPVPVAINRGFMSATAGLLHTCARTALGRIYCWGNNWYGQVGAWTSGTAEPMTVDSLTRFLTVRALGNRTCAIASGDVLQCWGRNQDGALGMGARDDSIPNNRVPFPRRMATRNVTLVSLGSGLGEHFCGLTDDDEVACWGGNEYGQIDASHETYTRPVLIQLGAE